MKKSPFDILVGPNWRLASKRRTQKKRRARFAKVMNRLLKRERGMSNRCTRDIAFNAAFDSMQPGDELKFSPAGLAYLQKVSP